MTIILLFTLAGLILLRVMVAIEDARLARLETGSDNQP